MVDIKQALLGLDMDTSLALLGRDRYADALNITRDAVVDSNGDFVISKVLGNRMVAYTLPTGTNKVIGAFGHPVRNTVYYFVFNSNGNHLILEYNNTARTITKVLESKTDSATIDILGFTTDDKITSVNIIPTDDGDLLFFLDSLKRPTALNITRCKAGTYTPITRDIIDFAKNPPLSPPTAAYGNDTTRRVNHLRNKRFRFRTRYIYDDNYKTTCSPISKSAIPASILNDTFTNEITNNNKVTVTFKTGDKSIKAVELLVSYVEKTNSWSDFLSVKVFNKASESIGNDTTITYDFYNDGTYAPIPIEESLQLFDYVPDKANCMDFANGNVACFAGITEGLSRTLTPNVTITVGSTTQGSVGTSGSLVGWTENEGLFRDYFLSEVNFAGTPAIGTQVIVRAQRKSDGQIIDISTFTTTTTTINDIALGLEANLTGAWVTVDSLGATWIRFALDRDYWTPIGDYATGPYTQVGIIPPSSVGPSASDSTPAWKWSSERRLALVYFDKKGKTNGVLYDAKVTFPAYAESGGLPLVPTLNVKIYHQPPSWAHSYQYVMNKDNNWFIYWHTVDIVSDTSYIYFNVTNFKTNAEKRPTTASVLNYSFVEGDRLRLIKKMSDGTVFNDTYDAAIEGLVINPKISSNSYTGEYIKIKKTSPISGVDFATKNFLIEIYRPTQSLAGKDGETYFEFGVEYAILDAGLSTRRHSGGVSNQSTDLTTTPAETQLNEGDCYFRVRNISLSESGAATFFCIDKNFVDFYKSAVSSFDGRPTMIDPDAKQAYYPTLIRFGQAFEQNTNINGLNRFYQNNFDEYAYTYGDVMRIKARDKYLHIFQKLKVGTVPIFGQIAKDNNGGALSIVTDKLLNPIQYYVGDFGIGSASESLASDRFADYFVDNIKGKILRLSMNGIEVISDLYGVASWANREIPLRTGTSKIYGVFDQRKNQYIVALEATSGGSLAQTIVFAEYDNSFESFVSYQPEMMVSLGNLLISFKSGALWTHDHSIYNSFYGVTYSSTIKLVFNDKEPIRKTFLAFGYRANGAWSPLATSDIATNFVNPHTGLTQWSALIDSDFEQMEGQYTAAFLRDANSHTSSAVTGLLEGDYLIGNYIIVNLRSSGTRNVWLHSPYVTWQPSNRNF